MEQHQSDMVWIPGGITQIGSRRFNAEEGPVRQVNVSGFWIGRSEVTNAQFSRFVRDTGYITEAEQKKADAMIWEPESRRGGPWLGQSGATWRKPRGTTDSRRLDDHPVVQVTLNDARAYATWKGGDLPTEVEWERAARGGLRDAEFVWGDEAHPEGRQLANHYQGAFPVKDVGADGFAGRAPVACYPPNGYGLYDMAGNVWEWTRDVWSEAGVLVEGAHVVKGGSFLCSDDYCQRYRPAARQPGEDGMATEHTGFRIVRRVNSAR